MKEQDDLLTLLETERLCSQYMDCNLSVFEETELRYFLTKVDYHSPLIDEVRMIMNIDSYFTDKESDDQECSKKIKFGKWPSFINIAASIAIIFCIGICFLKSTSIGSVQSQEYYIAYVDGHRLCDDAARARIKTVKHSIDDFIKEMSELETSKQELIDNFFNP